MIRGSLPPSATLFEAVGTLESTRKTVVAVVDEAGRVAGTVTDGDVRRALLRGQGLDERLDAAMNATPVVANDAQAPAALLRLLREKEIEALPLVDTKGRLTRIVHLSELDQDGPPIECSGFETAIIMAGGRGRRLDPVTRDIPKPMVDVGGLPVIDRQVRKLAQACISRVFVAVHYLNNVIEQHLGDGSEFGLRIRYLREKEPLGTAGALSLLTDETKGPVLIVNGDVLTTSNYRSLCDFHRSHGADLTVSVTSHTIEIPFGVVQTDGVRVTGVREKPSQRYLCNAGIYSASPEVCGMVPRQGRFDMTQLVDECVVRGMKVVAFPLHEFWIDIGTPESLARARRELADA